MEKTGPMFKLFRRVMMRRGEGKRRIYEDNEIIIRCKDIVRCEAILLYFDEYEETLEGSSEICNAVIGKKEKSEHKYYMECTHVFVKMDDEVKEFNVPMTIYDMAIYLNSDEVCLR